MRFRLLNLVEIEQVKGVEIDPVTQARGNPGQPGREGDNNGKNQIEALPVLRGYSRSYRGRWI